MTANGRIPHIPALDGVRGVAVAAVLAYHLGAGLRGGFLGVDLFFVLSGHLITTLLVAEHDATGRIALGAFWARRARRLLPASLALIAVVVVGGAASLAPDRLASLRADALWALGYAANWRFVASQQAYFEQFEPASPLRHMWSLAVEEQLYLLWPPLVAALATLAPAAARWRHAAITATIAWAASAVAMAHVHATVGPSDAYMRTDTRAHDVLAGVVVALLLRSPARDGVARLLERALPITAAAVLAGMVVLGDGDGDYFEWLGAAYGVAAAMTIGAVHVAPTSVVARALAWSPLVWSGRRSYGVYLWHWPVHLALDQLDLAKGWPLVAAKVGVTLAIAELSFRAIERPIREGALARRPDRTTALIAVATTMAVAALVLVVTPASSVGARSQAPAEREPYVPAPDDGRLRLGLAGDSTMQSLVPGFRQLATERGWHLSDATVIECGVTGRAPPWRPDACGDAVVRMQDAMIAVADPHVVLVHSRFELEDAVAEGAEADTPEHHALTMAAYRATLARLGRGGATVVWIDTLRTSEGYCRTRGRTAWQCNHWQDTELRVGDYMALRDRAVDEAATRVVTLSLDDVLCPGHVCDHELGGQVPRPDGIHFSAAGAAWIAPTIVARAEGLGVPFAP